MKQEEGPKPIRQAGESLRERMDEIWDKIIVEKLLQCAVVVSGLFGAWWMYFSRSHSIWPLVFVTLLGGVYLFRLAVQVRQKIPEYRNLKKGMIGERLVEEQLDEIRKAGFDVFHDFVLTEGEYTENIDHVIVGPSGVFTLETKNWSGKGVPKDDRITFDGEKLKIGDYVQSDKLLKQSRRQAGKLQRLLQPEVETTLWVVPMLCFWDRYVRVTRFDPRGLQVLHQQGIRPAILSRQPELSPEVVRTLSQKLRALNRAD